MIFSKVTGSKTATFLRLRYLFLYRYFVLEICLNFYGLVKAAYGDKSIFLAGKITDVVNTISVHHF